MGRAAALLWLPVAPLVAMVVSLWDSVRSCWRAGRDIDFDTSAVVLAPIMHELDGPPLAYIDVLFDAWVYRGV